MTRPPVPSLVCSVACKRLAALMLLCCLVSLAGCSTDQKNDKKSEKKRAVPVTTAVAVRQSLPVELRATGHSEALLNVEIRSQVTGVLKTVHFQEGQEVKAGELLFTIDPRPFAAELAKAEAVLAKDRADLANARRDQGRYQPAAAKGIVSQEQADQAQTKVATLEATIQADQAAVESAKLSLGFCSIRAPFAGRTGELLSDQGNLIKANADGAMVTINRVDPILVSFTVPGQHLPEIRRFQQSGELKVLVEQPGQAPLTGQLVFIDNSVDPTTGVIRLKAELPNAGLRLWPGQLVAVRLHLTERNDCIVVPSQAVQMGQQGAYVYVIKADEITELRHITAGMRVQGVSLIESGIQAGERVVVDGQMLLDDGIKVVERSQAGGGKPANQPRQQP